MQSERTDIWNRFEKTDPAHTKQFQRGGGFRGTAINGTYIVKRLTAEFGPCGKGWRFVLDNERIEEGHALKSGDKAKVHIIRGHIEYKVDGDWYSTSPQFGQTMLVDENKNGTFTDEEAPKKSITDCISKCAVLLGIGADVHLGLFDDIKYVNQRKAEEAAEAMPSGADTGQGGGKPLPHNGNGQTKPPPEPLKRPVAAKPEDEAKNFAAKATAAVKAFETEGGLRTWEDRNKTGLDKLKVVDLRLWTDLDYVIVEQYAKLRPLNA